MGPAQLASLVSEALRDAGISAVLSGGAAISIYTENQYESRDLDFVTSAYVKDISRALEPLGFAKGDGRSFEHPDTDYYLEFPPGPLAAGGTVFTEWDRLETQFGTIQIMSPTQMVMDRLAAYAHWSDQPSLDQAVMVAMARPVDLDRLREWCEGESAADEYHVFLRALGREAQQRG
jgi:hypothetical protein